MIIKINKKLKIGPSLKPLLIAEISANHAGSKKNFLKHIVKAKQSGADLIKIQTYEAEDMIINKKFKINKGLWKNKRLWQLYEEAKTPFDWHHEAFKIAKKNNIELFSTPFSVRSLNFLKKFKPNIYKIASFEITDLNLINEIAKTKKPVILSTGLATEKEIKFAVSVIKKYHNKIILMYCVSSYPASNSEIDFRKIERLKKITKINNIGFSDHTLGLVAPTLSLAHGVCAIEKHYKISDKVISHDSKFSLSSNGFKELKKNIEIANQIYSSKEKKENKSSIFFRRSVFSTKDIKKGEKFTNKNVSCYRPFIGICASNYKKILSKKAKINIKSNSVIKDYFF